MKKIILKSLALVNFKGVRDFSIAFNDGITTVCGDNGTGKTTLYDAYLWLLFGKDSTGRSDGANGFNVKTTGEDGKPIYRLEHSVTAVLEVDEKEIKLQRSLVEKWQKVNGTTEEVMKDETQYFINDVRTGTKKEYQAEISEIIPEDVFRMITNPYYFTSLGAETQKDMLLEMVGNIDDEEVAATDPDFLALLDQINGTSLAKWAREIAAKKRACNDALATIPASIETAQKLMPESENWTVLEKQLKEVQDRVKEIDAQIADKSALNDEAYKRKMALMKQQADKRIKLQDRENTIRMEANAAHNKALSDIQQMENELSINQKNLDSYRNDKMNVDGKIDELNGKLVEMREQFKTVAKEQFPEPSGDVLVCPTCGEPYKGENLENAIAKLRGNFEQSKSKRQKDIQTKGKQYKAEYDRAVEQQTKLTGLIAKLEDDALEIKGNITIKKNNIPVAGNADEAIANDKECIGLRNDIAEIANQLQVEVPQADVSELQSEKADSNAAIADINKRLGKRAMIERVNKEIADLEEKRIANNQAKADLEKWEDVYLRFQKAKDEVLMQRINGLFNVVSFSFVKEQKNGGEKVTCYCMVNGVPYADVNACGKVNAGLDIINAICATKGISAPIFIDNRESFNQIIPTISQIVNLKVSNDKSLTIK
ncbi:AAA family ATPase [Leyella stercorea]|jgi:DNA repair exonuclease SbcCD ATPase subunit|uniref:AAA family ATPase n=1 Tax=Leyella stercorea TaxID=363265 RepID=UPI00242E61E7|nr:AAA family ATPase [Leyella stercorea]